MQIHVGQNRGYQSTLRCSSIAVQSLVAVHDPRFQESLDISEKIPVCDVMCEKLHKPPLIKVVEEALLSGRLHLKEMTYPITVKREQKYMDSRFDFYIEDSAGQQAYMEVKGVTLENDGIAMFPDAPTMRGAKHLKELIAAKQEGFISYAIFVIQMKGIDFFKTNAANDPDFDAAYCAARKAGVHIKAFDCIITPDSIVLDNEIKTL